MSGDHNTKIYMCIVDIVRNVSFCIYIIARLHNCCSSIYPWNQYKSFFMWHCCKMLWPKEKKIFHIEKEFVSDKVSNVIWSVIKLWTMGAFNIKCNKLSSTDHYWFVSIIYRIEMEWLRMYDQQNEIYPEEEMYLIKSKTIEVFPN